MTPAPKPAPFAVGQERAKLLLRRVNRFAIWLVWVAIARPLEKLADWLDRLNARMERRRG